MGEARAGQVTPAAAESRLLSYSRALLAVTAACLPLYTLRWQYGPLPTTLLENLILATIALYLVARWRERRLGVERSPHDFAILLLLLGGAIAVFVAKDHRAALGLYRAYFIEPIAIFYVAIDVLRRAADWRPVLVGLGVGSSAFAALNMVNFALAFAANRVSLGSPPSAIYQSANEVAMYLEPPVAFAAALILFATQRLDRVLGGIWALFLVPALMVTLSRGAFLALAGFAIFVILSLSPALRKPLFIALGVTAALAVITVALGSHTPLVIHRLSLKALEYTSVTRFEIFGATLLMLLHSPVFGLGLGGYLYVFHGFPEIYPHNMLLAFWVEVGLPGLVAFAIIFVSLFQSGRRTLPTSKGFDRVILWGAVGALVLWAVHGLFDSPYWKNDMSVEFWIVAAMLVTMVQAVGPAADLSGSAKGQAGPRPAS